jgi:hypothetical protein
MTETPSGSFSLAKYGVVRGLVTDPVRSFLHRYVLGALRAGKLRSGDDDLPHTPCCYADPLMEWLLESVRASIEATSGLSLLPTYSYLRVYQAGDVLKRHTDRPSCEVSVTLNVHSDAERPWPIWIEANGEPRAIALGPGDALVYRGTEVPHWRETFSGEQAIQVFLHYVHDLGAHREWIYDRRRGLNIPPAARRIMQMVSGQRGS